MADSKNWSKIAAGFVSASLALLLLSDGGPKTTYAHLVLTFPPARVWASDFLTNSNSLGPCGMPRGLNNPTSLLSGIQYNVTWDSNNLHWGGYRIELLSSNYSLIQTLFPMDSTSTMSMMDDNSTSTTMSTTTTTMSSTSDRSSSSDRSNQTASNDTTMMAMMMMNGNESGQEWGAAFDPTLTSKMIVLPSMDCDGCVIRLAHQTNLPSTAQAGNVFISCADVNIRKKVTRREYCSQHGTYSLDDQSCQCDRELDGQNCQFQDECMTLRDCNYNGACYNTESMGFPRRQCFCAPGFFGNQCEFRSAINVTNINFNDYQSEQLADDAVLAWRMIGANNDTVNDGMEAEIEFVLQVQNTTSWIALGLRSPNATADCRTFPQRPPLEVNIPQNNMAVVYTKGGMADAAANATIATPPSSLHPMECLDVVWAAAKGKMGRVRDMYTPSQQKPRDDEYYGGRMTLTAAMAFEDGNTTTLMFRRRLFSAHPTDAQINMGDAMHVAFARGQDPDNILVLASQGMSVSQLQNNPNISNPNYYPRKELKYHGADPNQRWFKSIVLLQNSQNTTQ